MKAIILFSLCLLAASAKAQDSNAVIFCSGSAWLSNATDSGYGFVGSLFMTQTIPPSGVTIQTQFNATPLYPNPSSGTFTVVIPNLGNHIQASLYDERGAFLLDATPFMARTKDELQFSFASVVAGPYTLVIDENKIRRAFKLSIRR
jgi:hypothetical protein